MKGMLDIYDQGNIVSAATSPFTGNIDPRIDVVKKGWNCPVYYKMTKASIRELYELFPYPRWNMD